MQIASLNGYVGFQNWDANGSQKSANISLSAGQSYYMEVQHQEGGGGDHVSVAWQGRGFARTPVMLAPSESAAPRFVRLATAATTRLESDGGEPLLMAVLDRPAGTTAITVDVAVGGTATAGSDYSLAPGTLTFASGEQMKLLPLSIVDDAVGESAELIVVSLSNPAGAQLVSPASHAITVLDAGTPVVSTLFATATSGTSPGTVVGTVAAAPAPGRGISSWTILAGNTGNRFAIDSAGQVTLVTPAGLPDPGGMQLVVRATDSLGSSGDGLVNIVCNAPAQGVVEQRWSGRDAFWNENWGGTTAYSGTLATFTTPQNAGSDYSRRLTGYLKPQVTGDYTFWVAGDDDCRLYLSGDGSASNKVLIGEVNGYTSYQSWDSQGSQKSPVIPLEAGKVYWLEAQQTEGGGGDHLSVAWSGPGISRTAIPSDVIFPNILGLDFDSPPVPPSIAVTSPGDGAAFESGDDVVVTAEVAGGSMAVSAVEFYRGASLIGSDPSAPYSVVWSGSTAGSHTLTARAVYSGGGVTSQGVGIDVSGNDLAGDPDNDGFTTGLEIALGTDPDLNGSRPPAIYADLRAWWKMDDAAGSLADDTTGRPQDGSLTGGVWTSGISGGALELDGASDQVLVGTSAALTGSGDFSLSAWVKIAPGSPAATVIQQRDPGAGGFLGQYMLNVHGDGTVNFLVYGTSVSQFDLTTAATVNDGEWHHLAAVRDGTSGAVYVDGIEAANGSGAIEALQSHSVAIGYDHGDSNKHFTGSIDDVRIYGRALSPQEIEGMHDELQPNRTPGFTSDPVVKSAATQDVTYSGSLSGEAMDPDAGDSLIFTKVSGAAWLSVASDGALSGVPANADAGPNSFVVRATDSEGLFGEAELLIEVMDVNDPPQFPLDPISGDPATEDTAYSASIADAADDIDAVDTKTYSKVSGPAWLSVAAGGALSGTPGNDDVGPNRFLVRVTDGGGLTDEAVLEIDVANVNDPPAFAADPISGTGATEDVAYSGSLAGVVVDVDSGDTSVFVKVSGPAWLVVAANGDLSGTPDNADVGPNRFTVRVTDAADASDEAVLDIEVANVNDPPVFLFDPILRASGREEAPYAGASLADAAVDGDAGDMMTFSKTSGPEWLTVGPDGSLGGTPPAGSAGLNVFTVRATDGSAALDEAQLQIEVDGAGLPLPWERADIGGGSLAGSASHDGGAYLISGAGELQRRSDTFHFAWQELSGDGQITARVAALDDTGDKSRVGVMVRDTLASNSRHVFMGLSGGGDFRWVRRTGFNGNTSTSKSGLAVVPGAWVRLTRSGTRITAYKSGDGVAWTQVGSLTADFPPTCYFGLAVCSGSDGTLNHSEFDNVSVTP